MLPNEVQRFLSLINESCKAVTSQSFNTMRAGCRELLATLREVVRVNKPKVLDLVETHVGGMQAMRIATMVGYDGSMRLEAEGFRGGIWVYWKKDLVTIAPIQRSEQHITMEITRVGETPWYFSAIYASPDSDQMARIMENFERVLYLTQLTLVISCCPETTRSSNRFNDWINDMKLLEVKFSRSPHTWARGHSIKIRGSARLDRAFVMVNGE
ncbi:5-methylthioadenosine/S-adenosylhomocysteine deaminase [Bienertia sinuspersici]